MAKSKRGYGSTNRKAYNGSRKYSNTARQRSKNYYRIKSGQKPINYKEIHETIISIGRGLIFILKLPFYIIEYFIIGIGKVDKYFKYNKRMKKNKNIKRNLNNNRKDLYETKSAFQYAVEATVQITTVLKLPYALESKMKEIAKDTFIFVAKLALNETVLKTYNTIMLTVKVGYIMFSIVEIIDKIQETRQLFYVQDGTFTAYRSEFQNIVEIIMANKRIRNDILQLVEESKQIVVSPFILNN